MARLELLEGVAEVPREEWNALVAEASPFLEWDWLASLEESACVDAGRGWTPRPLVLREEGRVVAACPLYLKENSEGEFVFDWGWADAAHRAGIDYYPKLLVGVPFTPVTGSRLLAAPGEQHDRRVQVLAEALRDLCEGNELSGVHTNFCREEELPALEAAGFQTRIGIQYHWHNHDYASFDDYLGRFRSKRRNQIRRERRELARQGVELEVLAGDRIGDDVFEPMYRFYLSTVRGHFYGRQYLNAAFFDLMRERFRERLVFVVARHGGKPIAGTFNVSKGDALYGRYWGSLRDLRYLHFNVCYYAAVEHCIGRGLARFEPGAGGDYKQMRGFDAQPTYSAHYLRDPRLRHAVGRFLERERAEARRSLAWLQDESALKPRSGNEAGDETGGGAGDRADGEAT